MGENDQLLDIESWEGLKVEDQEIISCFNDAASCANDIITDITGVKNIIDEINSSLAGIMPKDIIGGFQIETADDLYSSVKSYYDQLSQRTADLTGALLYYEAQIDIYGKDSPELKSLNEILQAASDYNLTWIAYAALRNTPFSGLAFMFAYGTDATHDSGHFVYGDLVFYNMKNWLNSITSQGLSEANLTWISAGTGAGIVFIVDGLIQLATDEGDPNWDSIILHAAGASTSYFLWTIASASIAGPGGAIVASCVVIPFTLLWNEFSESLTGNKVIYEYDYNGKHYKIAMNGGGKDNTFDVYLDRIKKQLNKNRYTINGEAYNKETYKKRLYTDFEEVIEEDLGSASVLASNRTYENLRTTMNTILECEDVETANQKFYDIISKDSNMRYLYEVLINDYDFDIKEYYVFHKGGSDI